MKIYLKSILSQQVDKIKITVKQQKYYYFSLMAKPFPHVDTLYRCPAGYAHEMHAYTDPNHCQSYSII